MEFVNEDSSLICENCKSDKVNIDPNTGEYYCEDCGIQQQEIRELDRDLDDVYFEISSGAEGRRSSVRRASQSTEKQKNDEFNFINSQNEESDFFNDSNSCGSSNYRTLFDKWYNKRPANIKNSDFFIGIQLIIQQIVKDMVERRQFKIEILYLSKRIWFAFLKYICKHKIPIRTFFADLRCSVLKVPFDETASSKFTNCNSDFCSSNEFAPIDETRLNKNFDDIFYSMGRDRIKYVIKLSSKIIKSLNSINICKASEYLKDFDKNSQHLIEEWEISGRKLHVLANNKKIPYTTWEGNSISSRYDIIKCVIDMIYEHDFLMLYFQKISNNNNNESTCTNIEEEFNKWIDAHIIFFDLHKKINTDENFMIFTYEKYLKQDKFNINTDYFIKRVHIIHIILHIILEEHSLKLLSENSLSTYNPIYKNRSDSFIHSNPKKRTLRENIDNAKSFFECPKLDYNLILCIVWMSLLKCGYTVSSHDIIEWVKSGKIDIFKSENIIPKWLKEAGFKWDNDMNSGKNTRSVTELSRIPTSNDLEKIIQFFKFKINILIPPISIPMLIHKILCKCRCLSFTGGISIQPICLQLWEFISKSDFFSKFNPSLISSSIIIVVSRAIWPIFVYHPAAIPQKQTDTGKTSLNYDKSIISEVLNIKTSPLNLEFFYDTNNSAWVANIVDNLNNLTKTFHSYIYGIEWSGVMAIKWLFSHLELLKNKYQYEVRKIFDHFLYSKREDLNEKIGKSLSNFRGNFFTTIRKKRQLQKKKLGDQNWSGIMPSCSILSELDPVSIERIAALSHYLPSNREIFNSLILETENKLKILFNNQSLQLWDSCDDYFRSQLYENWEKIFSTDKDNDVAEVLRNIFESTNAHLNDSILAFVKEEFKKDEVEVISTKTDTLLDYLFNIKFNYMNTLFQDPGLFTSIILPLPQFFHSKQKFTSVEASIPLAYIILLRHISQIVGLSYSSIHSCVVKIEELLTNNLRKEANKKNKPVF